ncbi:MAG: hypothetical protein AB4058_03535 [Microcystaceae cyanobacterium]
MADSTFDLTSIQIMAILRHYGFDLRGYTPLELLEQWERGYSAIWIRLAVIEALYQGRYKALSVEQILQHWLRKGKPTIHFNHEFERLICHKLPQGMESSSTSGGLEELSNSNTDPKKYLSDNNPKIDNEDSEDPPFSPQSHFKEDATPISQGTAICQFIPRIDHSSSYAKLREAVYKGLEQGNNSQNPE